VIDNLLIASIPFAIAGAIVTYVQLNRGTYRFVVTKRLMFILAVCAIATTPLSCMIWEWRSCSYLPLQTELFFLGYFGASLFLICAPTLGGYVLGQGAGALMQSITTRIRG